MLALSAARAFHGKTKHRRPNRQTDPLNLRYVDVQLLKPFADRLQNRQFRRCLGQAIAQVLERSGCDAVRTSDATFIESVAHGPQPFAHQISQRPGDGVKFAQRFRERAEFRVGALIMGGELLVENLKTLGNDRPV